MPEIMEAVTSPSSEVVDMPEVDVETAEPIDETEAAEPAESADVDSETAESVQTSAAPDDGKIMGEQLKKYLNELKTTDPAKARAIRDEFFRGIRNAQKGWYQEFPGGVQEAKQLKQFITEVGGKEGIEDLKFNSDAILQLDQLIDNGDPKVFDSLMQLNPKAFAQLGPKFLSKFSEVDPQGYQRTAAGLISSAIGNSGLANHLYLVKTMLEVGNTDKALALVGGIEKWITDLNEIATKEPEAPKPDARMAELDTRAKQLDQREVEQFNASVTNEVRSWRDSQIRDQLKALLNGRKISDEKAGDIQLAILNRLAPMLQQRPGFAQKMDAYSAAKDKAGMTKFLKAEMGALLPGITKKVFRLWFSDATLGSKKPAAVPQNGAKPTTKVLTQAPRPEQIDRSRTDRKMILNNQAILKDGTKVSWATA